MFDFFIMKSVSSIKRIYLLIQINGLLEFYFVDILPMKRRPVKGFRISTMPKCIRL